MKTDKYGLDVFKKQKYNLFYVDRGLVPKEHLIIIAEGDREVGSLLEGFLGERETLSHHPPALPFLLGISHRIFANKMFYLVSGSNDIYLMLRNSAFQFFACFVNLLSSLLLILAVYFLGSLFFSHKVGLLSALFLSLTPTDLMTANKIWADDMTALFATLAVILYLYVLKKNRPAFSLLGGLSCGISILTKMSGIYIIFVILLFHLLEHRKDKVNIRNLLIFFFDRNILYFLAGVFIASAWWFDLYYSNFSLQTAQSYFRVNEIWEPAKNWSLFFNMVSNRPWYSYFILIPFQFPLYLLGFVFIPMFILSKRIKWFGKLIVEQYRYLKFLIIWVTVVFIFLTLKPGKELRYMLIAYPAISVLSVYCLNLIYEWMKNRNLGISLGLQRLFFISVILLSLAFSLKIALPSILIRADIIPIPL
ncbi:MAG: phospholipid carrier-dependent glycosyltransferase [Candidatus Omnitrophica bacterium]|nr:phospholipid carrier-dependent glycosyltransferase [Candidatus Omnitrophota bacterium]MDD5550274.1 phospholipid carrier-dependent glycosyltransferase [Candidatus Omnitrophota bacterium]